MKAKTVIGWTVIVILCLIPVYMLFYFGPGAGELGDYASITHTFGEIFGLVGMTMFALTFLLSTRISAIEDVFGGLDKVYIAHGILGGSALIFILFHPIFLVLKFIPNDMQTAAMYLLPSSYWSVNFGIIALMGLIAPIFFTLFTRIRYNKWKFSHEFLGLAFAFAVLHIFMVRGTASKDLIFQGYYVYAAIVSAIGLGAFSYSLFLKDRMFKNAVYTISSIRSYKDSFAIGMIPEHKPLRYKSGQFIFVRFFNEKLTKEQHPFSIASKSNAHEIKIVVKKLGDFTSRLENLKERDRVSIEGPYGRFNYNRFGSKRQVWIAGGIGIAPFIGMAQDIAESPGQWQGVDLYYSASHESDFIGLNLFNSVASRTGKFRFLPWNSEKRGYLTAEKINDLSKGVKDREFFLCGPEGFKNSIIKNLMNLGVPKDSIHEEVFDFR